MKKLVFASRNKGKIKEVAEILSGYEILSLNDLSFDGDIEETGKTFEENSFIKAKAAFDSFRLPSIADDSGLCVDALGGAPGIYSARYSGEHGDDKSNRALLLENMKGVADRSAKFVTVITYIDENGNASYYAGETLGEILHGEDGDMGFGYDPIFFSYELKKSFGQALPEEKNSVSHRYKALKKLSEALSEK